MRIDLQLMHPAATAPSYATSGAAGVDLRAVTVDGRDLMPCEAFLLLPGQQATFGTGIAVDMAGAGARFRENGGVDWVALQATILPRSGLGASGIVLGNLVGLVDEDFHGEIRVCLWNRGQEAKAIHLHDRIAQLVFGFAIRATLNPVEAFATTTHRSAEGFGSTGTN